MRALVLAAGLLLTATATSAQTRIGQSATLLGPHVICSRPAVAAELVATRNNAKAFNQRQRELHTQGLCATLPKGTHVYLEDQDRMFSCLRPVNVPGMRADELPRICGWTVLVERQARQFR